MTATSIAEIFVTEESIRVELEIGGPDLMGFKNLMPDQVYEKTRFRTQTAQGEISAVLSRGLSSFERDGGDPLPAYVVSMEPTAEGASRRDHR